MVCDASFDSGPHYIPSFEHGFAITFDEIGRDDKILIKTRNSEYRFSVTDPVNHRGLLSGGTIGDQPREAVLIESLDRGETGRIGDFGGLKTGARALFYIASSQNRVERVTTSEISSLSVVKGADRRSLIS